MTDTPTQWTIEPCLCGNTSCMTQRLTNGKHHIGTIDDPDDALIARAAPELLAALEALARHDFDGQHDMVIYNEVYRRARAAIAPCTVAGQAPRTAGAHYGESDMSDEFPLRPQSEITIEIGQQVIEAADTIKKFVPDCQAVIEFVLDGKFYTATIRDKPGDPSNE